MSIQHCRQVCILRKTKPPGDTLRLAERRHYCSFVLITCSLGKGKNPISIFANLMMSWRGLTTQPSRSRRKNREVLVSHFLLLLFLSEKQRLFQLVGYSHSFIG